MNDLAVRALVVVVPLAAGGFGFLVWTVIDGVAERHRIAREQANDDAVRLAFPPPTEPVSSDPNAPPAYRSTPPPAQEEFDA